MASLAQLRTAITSTLTSAIPGLEGHDKVPESINVPGFMVIPRAGDYDKAFGRGLDGYGFDVVILVSRAVDELAQGELDDYVNGFGAKSIRQAIWNNRKLGFEVDAAVTGFSDYGASFEVGGVDYVGARVAVDVLTSGNA